MTALPVPGYPDYTLTMSGIVRRNGKLVRIGPDCTGHARTVTLWKDRKRKRFMLHKLISQTFQVPEEDVKKALYEGFRMEPEAKKMNKVFILIHVIVTLRQGECRLK